MFQDRREAGILLAEKIPREVKNAVVVGLPRGGVVVAYEVAKSLGMSFTIIVVKKIGAPYNTELAIGAIGPGNTTFWDAHLIESIGIERRTLSFLRNQKEKERKAQENLFLAGHKQIVMKGKTVVLVDDGVATGATAICAAKYLRKKMAGSILLAIPVISRSTYEGISRFFDIMVALRVEEHFYAVGQFYKEFPQVEDKEVMEILKIRK